MPPDAGHLAIIAGELTAVATDMEAIGVALCSDPAVASVHSSALQTIDSIAQRQRALAELLVAENIDGALSACSLDRIVRLFG